MDANDIGRMADRATNLFRLETLPVYDVGEEADDFAAWQRGDRILPTLETDEWLQKIRNTTAAGACWSRVRILDYPLTEYSEFELYGYQANARAGERIYVADRSWDPELKGLRDDFWMFDDTVVCMIYDEAGRFVRAERPENERRFLGVQSVALHNSVPLDDFLAAHEPRLIA
jgi:hypothetical protein